MKEIFRTTDPAQIALLTSLFSSTEVRLFTFDAYTNSAMGGILGASTPCRFMVLDDEFNQACEILKDCGLEPSTHEQK